MKTIFMFGLNLLTILTILFLSLLVWMIVSGQVNNWIVFAEVYLIPAGINFIIIMSVNYSSFGKITLWHKNIKDRTN